MVSKLVQILRDHSDAAPFVKVIAKAFEFLQSSTITREKLATGNGQSSAYVRNLYVFRRDRGLWDNTSVVGLDETIGSLRCS